VFSGFTSERLNGKFELTRRRVCGRYRFYLFRENYVVNNKNNAPTIFG
jgi:hypothetical protein